MRVWLWIIVGCFVGLYPYGTQGQISKRGAELRKLIGIVPIESTSQDVRKLLGEPLDESPDFYKLHDHNVLITYSSGLPCEHPCYEKGRSDGWNVARDTVVTVAVFIKSPFHQKDLKNVGIDLREYEQTENADHIKGTVYYSNPAKGIGVTINGDAVTGIRLFPAKKYFHLMCSLTNNRPACQTSKTSGTRGTAGAVSLKRWRGLVPLRSTRADVKRLIGKENELGRYQFEDERAYILYSDGPCRGVYQGLQKDRCECLVPEGTVLSIHVTLEVPRKFSTLKLDAAKYTRELIRPGTPTYAYSNTIEGVVYRVDEADDEIIGVEYLPSAKTCQAVIQNAQSMPRNVWRGLSPLHSTRVDVERLLGPANSSNVSANIYKSESEAISVRYASGNCMPSDLGWSVPKDTIMEIDVTPLATVLLNDLELNISNYERVESSHPENLFYYTNLEDGVTIQTKLQDGCEKVMSIKYGASRKDLELACPRAR